MFAINVLLSVKESGDVAAVGDLLREAGRLSRQEPGCQVFEVCHSQGDSQVYMLIERWESRESWEVHKTAQAFTTIYQPQVLPKVDRVAHFCDILE